MAAKRRAVEYWFTVEEWGTDKRTGAVVRCRERLRRAGDRPGASDTVWGWQVVVEDRIVTSGTAQNQGGARAAIRRCVFLLPDRKKPEATP